MNALTHDKGLLVQVYTVDDRVDYKKVMDAGVDGIFTNRAAGAEVLQTAVAAFGG